MAHPAHAGASVAELARLADDICFLAGHTSLDSSWYARRASLAAIYASSGMLRASNPVFQEPPLATSTPHCMLVYHARFDKAAFKLKFFLLTACTLELYMTQDRSPDFSQTQAFLNRRLKEADWLGTGLSNVGAWLGFNGHALVNVLRSKGLRI